VTVRVEGKARTLLAPTKVRTHSGWITSYGAPRGACPARSGAGALEVATHHRWTGKFSAMLRDYFITRILGDFESGSRQFWDIFVNHRSATTGACGIKLHPGDQLLFAVASATSPRPTYTIALSGPGQARVGGSFAVKVVWWGGHGTAKPLAGARVSGAGVRVVTNRRGIATITVSHVGTLVLQASHAGYVRSAPLRVQELP
jgi:Domain of unknown function (DUF4430)